MPKKLSKKSIIMARLLKIMYLLVAAGVIFAIMSPLSGKVIAKTKEGVCQTTVAMKVSTFNLLPEKCPANFIRIYENKITKDDKALPYKIKNPDGKTYKTTYNLAKNSEHMAPFIYKTIGDEMVSCWNKFGKGQDIFDGEFWEKSRNCAICTNINFDPSAQSLGMLQGLHNYLYNTPIKKKEQTYYEYLGLGAISNVDNVIDLTLEHKDLPQEEIEDYKEGRIQYYRGDKWVLDANTKLDPAASSGYTILYYVWSRPSTQKVANLYHKHDLQIPAQIFIVKTEDITTYLCENFMN